MECKEQGDHVGDLSLDDISIRSLDFSDIDDFMEWATDDEVTRFLPWNTYTSREDGLHFIKEIAIPHPYYKAICYKNRAIGSITVSPPESGEGSCRGELGYVLASKYWGKGIVTRAVQMVAAHVFLDQAHLERLEALVRVENLASQRVLQKAGFTREGVLRKYKRIKGVTVDMIMFSLLSTDYISVDVEC